MNNFFGLVKMTFGLVDVGYSLPFGQAVKLIFFAYTYFKLKHSLRVSLRVEHWSTVILTCSWSISTKCYFYIRFLLILNLTSKFVNFVISSLWWFPVTCPPRASWHVRVLSLKPCLHTQLQKHIGCNRSYWKVKQ